jgi:hypothetical protein
MPDHFLIPLLISHFFDALLGLPELNAMGHLNLKCLQLHAGILPALAAEADSFIGRAFVHFTIVSTVIG